MTRFDKAQMHCIYHHFFGRMKSTHYIFCKNKFSYEETLIIALDYMANGHKYSSLKHRYGGDWTRYTYPINFFARFLYKRFYHRLTGNSLNYLADKVDIYREAMWKTCCFDEEGNNVSGYNLNEWRPWCLIDCQQHDTCCPGSGPVYKNNDDSDAEMNGNEDGDRRQNAYAIQRAFYTRYGKKWGMKTQVLFCPDGMVGSAFFICFSK